MSSDKDGWPAKPGSLSEYLALPAKAKEALMELEKAEKKYADAMLAARTKERPGK